MSDRPHGTVTFLFTDIEGSTRLWQANHDAMTTAYARHDAILRVAIAAHGGSVYKTIGDAVQVAFPTAPQAVTATFAAQRDLQTEATPNRDEAVEMLAQEHRLVPYLAGTPKNKEDRDGRR